MQSLKGKVFENMRRVCVREIPPGKDVSIIFLAQMDTDIPLSCLQRNPVYILICLYRHACTGMHSLHYGLDCHRVSLLCGGTRTPDAAIGSHRASRPHVATV